MLELNSNGNPIVDKKFVERNIGKRIRLKVFNHYFNDVLIICREDEITDEMIENTNLFLNNKYINKRGLIGRLYTYYSYIYLLTHDKIDKYPKRSKFVKKLHIESIEITSDEVIIVGRIINNAINDFGWVGGKKFWFKLNKNKEIETIKDPNLISYIKNRKRTEYLINVKQLDSLMDTMIKQGKKENKPDEYLNKLTQSKDIIESLIKK